MKILAYNINKSTQEKIDEILGYDADIFILPEIACPSMVKLPTGYQMEWTGDIDFKGLGIIWKESLKVEVPEWFNPQHQYCYYKLGECHLHLSITQAKPFAVLFSELTK